MDFVVSYSCGKDSALALYRMIRAGHRPVAMLTTVNAKEDRSWFHGVSAEVIEEISKSLGIPLITCRCEPEGYLEAIEKGLAQAKDMGAQACVFGDIDIADHKTWNERLCQSAGLECIMPLWGGDREALIAESIDSGFKSMIKIVQKALLDDSFLGETLTRELVKKIKAAGADACGENGEYHTIVYDGPVFFFPVPLEAGRLVDFPEHMAIDVGLRAF